MSVVAFDPKRKAEPAAAASSLARGAAAESLLERAAALAGIGAWSCDLSDESLSWTAGVFDLFGLPPGKRLDRRELVGFYAPESRQTMERLRAAAIAGRGPFTLDAEIVRPDGERRWMRLTGDVVRESGRPVQLYGLKQDISEEKERWEALRRRAEWDSLTGLANRSVFQHLFLDNGPASPGVAPLAALVLVDLDGFKQVNDRHGHAAGDACLETIGQRLSLGFPNALMAARIGGDEFALLLADRGETRGALETRIRRQLRDLSAPILWRGELLQLTVSAGLAAVEHPSRYDAEALFAAADLALYRAKHRGKNRLCTAARDLSASR